MTKLNEWIEFQKNNKWYFKDEMLCALKIIEHLKKACEKYSQKELWDCGERGPEVRSCHFYTAEVNGYTLAQEALEKSNKEIDG